MTNDTSSNTTTEEINQIFRRKNDELTQELAQLKAAVFTGDINAAVHSAHEGVQKMNAEYQARADEQNRRNTEQREAAQAATYEAEKKAVLDAHPDLLKYCNDRKAEITTTRDKMAELVNRFYDMTPEQARLYLDISERPEESAVKYLLQTTTDEDGETTYECRHCGDKSYKLDEFERHCFLQQADHRDATISAIQDEAWQNIAKASNELQNDIDTAIKAKHDTEYRSRIAKERAAKNKLKETLPFAAK